MLAFEEAVTRMMDEDHIVDVIYLNFATTFDSINHRFLLAKTKSFGLGEAVVRWIAAHLSGWASRVHVEEESSGTIPLRSGVPQGSMTGPLLFLFFLNDLLDSLEALTLLMVDNFKMVTPGQRT